MPRQKYKNAWGSSAADGGIDQQRADLFRVTIHLPPLLGGVGVWSNDVEFAVDKFPFPDRTREMIPIKYMNQTNYQIGADTQVGPVEIPVRYAFNQHTAQVLERWNYLTSNPETGGVGLTSAIKANGYFRWMVPDMNAQVAGLNGSTTGDVMKDGLVYRLEGCLIRGLKFTDADMAQGNQVVNLTFSLQVDRYYPQNINAMVISTTGSINGTLA